MLKNMLQPNPWVWLGRVSLGVIFLLSGAMKIPYALDFAHNVAGYQLLPYWANILTASLLPWVEGFCGLLLIVGFRVRACSLFAVASLLLFIAAMLSAAARGLEIDCGCFQVGKSAVPTPLWVSLLRDLGFLTLAVALLWAHRSGPDNSDR